MTAAEVVRTLEETQALLSGHFLLSSGRHGDRYIQSALALKHPRIAEKFGTGIAELFRGDRPDLVVSPALGGVIIGHETARALDVPFLFTERAGTAMALRRNFRIEAGQRALMVEDVITTGGSVLEAARLVTDAGGVLAGFGCIGDRTGGTAALPARFAALAVLDFASWPPDACPLCRAGAPPPVKPGSRPGGGA